MTDQELRTVFIQVLKMGEDDDLQMVSFMNDIFHYCMENEMITQEDLGRNVSFERFSQSGTGRPGEFDKKHWKKIAQWFWEFVARGIVITGTGPHECNLPWFQVTEYGKEVLDSELEPIPEDNQGYMQYLKTKINDIDDVVLIYPIFRRLKT